MTLVRNQDFPKTFYCWCVAAGNISNAEIVSNGPVRILLWLEGWTRWVAWSTFRALETVYGFIIGQVSASTNDLENLVSCLLFFYRRQRRQTYCWNSVEDETDHSWLHSELGIIKCCLHWWIRGFLVFVKLFLIIVCSDLNIVLPLILNGNWIEITLSYQEQ